MAILSMATVPNRGYENPVAGFKATLNRGHYASLNNLSFRVPNPCTVMFASSHTRFIRRLPRNFRIVCTAASSAGGSSASNDENPYEVLGVSPIERFDVIKASYTKKYKDAEKRGDGAAMAQLERAYDKIMMAQLSNRKRGVTFGSIEVSKDIRYADKQPIVPWGPRSFFPHFSSTLMTQNRIRELFCTCMDGTGWNSRYRNIRGEYRFNVTGG